MKQEIRITRKNGVIRMTDNGDEYMWCIANGMFARGAIKPTFSQKLTRFCKRLRRELSKQVDNLCEAVVGSEESVRNEQKVDSQRPKIICLPDRRSV